MFFMACIRTKIFHCQFVSLPQAYTRVCSPPTTKGYFTVCAFMNYKVCHLITTIKKTFLFSYYTFIFTIVGTEEKCG